jgi:hypothetical protein
MGVSENALLARARGYLLRIVVLAAFMLLMTLLYASTVRADTFTVTNLNDSGTGSLREAIEAAEANAGVDEIVFADGVSGTVTLASALPIVRDPAGLIIDGGGDVTVSGNGAVQVFRVDEGAALSLRSLTISGGRGARFDNPEGGGIVNLGGTVVVTNSIIAGNNAHQVGGGIFNTGGGAVTVTDSTISRNSTGEFGAGQGIYNESGMVEVINSTISENGGEGSSGGGIANSPDATLEVTGSTFLGNRQFSGGGIANFGGAVNVTDSTFSGNRGHGAAIFNGNAFNPDSVGSLEVTNSTFSSNRAVVFDCFSQPDCVEVEVPGGAIDNRGGTVEVTNSTFSGNSASTGSAIANGNDGAGNPGKATLRNTIVANSTSGGNCGGEAPIADGGYNVSDDTSCEFNATNGSLQDTDPLLDAEGLQDNGGPTLTIALLPESPAVDLVGQDACPPPETDQRGVERPQGEACDSGAFELVQGPQTKADCKQGGWEEFGFKNQGQCIASLQKEQVQTSQ